MSDDRHAAGEAGVSARTMEIAVALLLLAIGVVVVYDSNRLGASWGSDGPQSGYFPFYIGLLLSVSSGATLIRIALTEWKRRGEFRGALAERAARFVGWDELKLVLAVLVPALLFVAVVQLIGIYVASAIYIALFMRWLGKYRWPKSVAVGLMVSATTFVLFEVWFKVPLFKGAFDPLAWLGY
jgi:hypothetical protein